MAAMFFLTLHSVHRWPERRWQQTWCKNKNTVSDLQEVDEFLAAVVTPPGGQMMKTPSDEDVEELYILAAAAAAAVYCFHWQLASKSDSERQVFAVDQQRLRLTVSVVS